MLNGANGMSDMAGNAAQVAVEHRGKRSRYNGANGMSDPPTPTRYGAAGMEGKATRVGTSERGKRASFKAESA
jgi:hypothetical protein